ncbi:MAG: cobalamin-dependent protein [Kiritimatiellae bacterium]|nr:cobalamin-dependent protein [Kiritimatiellia bacterium]
MKFALVAFGNEESYGLLFVGGELKRHGQTIRFFDAEQADAVESVIAWRPHFVCFSPLTTFFARALQIAGAVKAALPDAVTVFGGHHVTAVPASVEAEEIDAAVVGPVRGAVERLLAGERGEIHTPLTTPDDLPLPARQEYYADVPRMGGRYRKIMCAMLGCPWNCAYCSSAAGHMRGIFGNEAHTRYFLARRPLAALLAEARAIVAWDTLEIEWVDDDVLHGDDAGDWLPEFAAAWREEIGLPLYVSSTSVNVLRVPDSALRALRQVANCVGLGVQAIRPQSLKLFNRAWDSESRMKEAYDRLTTFGFRVNLQGIVGLPVEDPVEDAIDTIKGMQRIGPGSVCSCYPLIVYPGTEMARYCSRRGLAMNEACTGDTNTGVPSLAFPPEVLRRLRNACKLATLFVRFNVDEKWMRPLLDIEFDDETSKALSTVRYFECVRDRLGEKGERAFAQILAGMRLRY